MAELSEPDESLISSCVAIEPIRFRGAAKQQIPEFLDAVEANSR